MPPVRRPSTRPRSSNPGNTESVPSSAQGATGRVTGSRPRPLAGGGSPVTPKPTKKDNTLASDLSQLYTLTGVMVGMVRPELAESIVENADDAATAWVELSNRNPKVRKALEDLTAASVWGSVVAVHMRMLAPALVGVIGGGSVPKPVNPPQPVNSPHAPAQDPTDPIEAQLAFMRETDPAAYELAMQMMAGSRDGGTGGPGDTVRTNGQPAPGIQTPADLGLNN